MRLVAFVLVVAIGAVSGCAAVSGLDAYSSSPTGGGGPGEASTGGSSDEGAVTPDDGGDTGGGGCLTECSTSVANATAACIGGGCGFTCSGGHALCNGACVDFTSDDQNCGGCGASYACASGATCR